MQQEFTKFLAIIAIIAVIICMVLALLGTIGAVKITDGCFYRYNFNAQGSPIDVISKTVNLKAHANYTGKSTTDSLGNLLIELDPNKYGQWLNSNLVTVSNQEIKYQVKGELSLCRSYLPRNNLQNVNNVDNNGAKIPIPRIEEEGLDPVSLFFSAKIDEWRNIAELYRNDQIIISASPERKDTVSFGGNKIPARNVTFKDIFTGGVITKDCSDDKDEYDPICGKFSIYSGKYTSSCEKNDDCYDCQCEDRCYGLRTNLRCNWDDEIGYDCFLWCKCWSGCEKWGCLRCGCMQNVERDMPEAYRGDGYYTQGWTRNWNELIRNFKPQCNSGNPDYKDQSASILSPTYQDNRRFWFSANDVAGLLFRLDNSENPTNAKQRGTNFDFAEIQSDQSAYRNDPEHRIIYNQNYVTGDTVYLQYRFHANDGKFTDNTGGYVLNVKHTKCRRTNGAVISDSVAERGKIEYKVVPFGKNPNDPAAPSYISGEMTTTNDGKGTITLPSGAEGYLWLKILNAPNDYKDSIGEYSVHFLSANNVGNFALLILEPLMNLKQKIIDAGVTVSKNMICYQRTPTANCTNFFNYVRALLSLYIAFQGLMFLLGMVQMNQMELVKQIVKIIIVAGLVNERTFGFFYAQIFPFITSFCDTIIANIAGYELTTSASGIANPLMFMDTLMSRLLFSQTFLGQLLALLSMGISGVLYFVLTFIAVVITIITILRAVAVYLMAFAAIAVLIGIAPIFFTFILFDSTRYLFDNWVRFTVRYMVEPVVLFAGIIILTQLFTIYLDYAIGYSVCWKCALPIKLPFPAIPGFPAIFSNLELFCLNWFAPWGLDHRSGMLGVNIAHIISLVIIAYCLYGYIDLSSKMVVKLVGGFGGPSATSMGQSMTSAFELRAQKSVGLDPNSRRDINAGAKQRLKNRVSAINKHQKNLRKESAQNNGTNTGNDDAQNNE